MFWQFFFFVFIMSLGIGCYYTQRYAKRLGIENDPTSIAFLNATANCLAIAFVCNVLSILQYLS